MYYFETTKVITQSLERLQQLRERLDMRGTLPRMWLARTRWELEAEATAASTSMEGVSVTVDEVRRVLAGDRPTSVAPQDVAFVEGYRAAMNFALRRADDRDFAWHSKLVLGIHNLVMAEEQSMGAGRFRQTQNRLVDASEGQDLHLPPLSGRVPALVADLTAWAQGAVDTPAPLIAALIHCRLAGIDPFADGTGRTARILASLAMYRGGYRTPEFTNLEEWWGRHLADYHAAFACLGSEWADDADVTPFVEAHLQAQVKQVQALSLKQATERVLWLALEDAATHVAEGDSRMAHALYDAFLGREVTNRFYRGLADVSAGTAVNDLVRLETSNLLSARGAGRSRRYVAGRRLNTQIAESAGIGAALHIEAPSHSQRDALLAALSEKAKTAGMGW
jgi:Fic family protein